MAYLGAIAVLDNDNEAIYGIPLLLPAAQLLPQTATIAGTILDDSGVPVARVVRAVRRVDGIVVGQATSSNSTGAYSLNVAAGAEYNVIFLDDAAGTLHNDLIHRVLP